jgi:alanine racemase
MPDATGGVPAASGAVLTIDLDAIAENWRQLSARAKGAECAGVVKANAYGLGAGRVAPALAAAGCRSFFVATIDEGIALRRSLFEACRPSATAPAPAIYVLNGVLPGTEADVADEGLIPVLNTFAQVEAWSALAGRLDRALPAALHIDTGMSRLGLAADELARLKADLRPLAAIRLVLLMSHLACADEPGHPLNDGQRARFLAAVAGLPRARLSLANSSGICLGPACHFDMVRPGAALYGVNPQPLEANPMRHTVVLQGRILQVREIDSPQTVGYGATHRAQSRARIATVAVGYADGYHRALSNRGSGFIEGMRVPLVGRVSMDLVTFDVSAAAAARPGAFVELIGPNLPVDTVARDAGTIGYEILTALGPRYHRRYVGMGASAP